MLIAVLLAVVRQQFVMGINCSMFLYSSGANRRLDLLCVVCIGLLTAEFSTVNTELGRPMFWKPLCLLSTPEGLATTNCQLT